VVALKKAGEKTKGCRTKRDVGQYPRDRIRARTRASTRAQVAVRCQSRRAVHDGCEHLSKQLAVAALVVENSHKLLGVLALSP